MKETTMLIVDVSKDLFDNNKYKLKIAFNILAMISGCNILYEHKTDDLSVMFLNTRNSNEKGIELFKEFSQSTFQGLREIRQYYEQIQNNEKSQDIFLVIKETIELFRQKYKDKKYKKKIYLITSGNFKQSFTFEQIQEVGESLIKNRISTNIISLDFWTDEEDFQSIQETEDLNRTQIQNIQRIRTFIDTCQSYCLVFDHNLAMKILQDFKTAKTNKVCLYKGDFELTPSCKLQVQVFSKVKQRKFPTLTKFSKLSQFYDNSKDRVSTKSIFFNPEDPQMKEFDKEDIIKGYFYGQKIVPIDQEQEDQLKFQEDKCIKLLGFIDSEKVKHQWFMSETECIYPSQESEQNNIRAFNAIVESMLRLKRVCIVRYVKKNNSCVQLAVLFPKRKITEQENIMYYMYLVQMPTIEDIRDYSFGSLVKSNNNQRQLMSEYIDRMNIKQFVDEDGQEKELLNPQETFNPTLQILNDNIMERGVTGQQKKIKVRQEILDYVNTEEKTHKKIEDMEQEIIQTFDLQILEEDENRRKVFWNEILQQRLSDNELLIQKMKDEKQNNVPQEIGKNYPVSDFREMLNYRKEDLTEKAVQQMQDRIIEIISSSVEGSNFGKALECLNALRDGCVSEEEPDLYNTFLINFKKSINEKKQFISFWNLLKNQQQFSLIYDTEMPRSNFTLQHSQQFLLDDEFFGNIEELTNLGNLKKFADDLD